jgi:hypothetical protein
VSPTPSSGTQPRWESRTFALALLAGAMAAAAIVLIYESRGQTIRGDELGYAARLGSKPFAEAIFNSPPNKYFLPVPLALYDAMFNVFGLVADVPYRIVVTALVLLSGGLFFALVRRRVGDLMALPPTLLLLFFGSGWETTITAIRIPSLIAVAAGLGTLLVLERRDLRGDVAAAVLLTVAIASHPIGLSFLAAAGVLVVVRPSPERWRTAWVLAIPAAVFGAWWLFLRAPNTASFAPTGVSDIVHFAVDSWTSITAHVSGLAGLIDQPTFDQTIAQVAAAALAAAIIAAVVIWWRRVPATFWAALVAFVVLASSTRLSPGGFLRSPDEVRYLYPEGVLLLLLVMEAAAIARLRAWAALGFAVVLLLGLVYNVGQLRDGGGIARATSQEALGNYSAYEIAGSPLDESYKPGDFAPSARQYVEAARAYGSVADSPAELQTASALERAGADAALPGSLGLAVQPVSAGRPGGGAAPKVTRVWSGKVAHRQGCVRLQPGLPQATPPPPRIPLDPELSRKAILGRVVRGLSPRPTETLAQLAELTVPPGELRLYAPDVSRTGILLARFAEPPTAQLDRPGGDRAGVLRLPASGLALPWRVTVAANQPVTVCGSGAGGAP